jgi:hypothetical protein
MKYRDKPRLIVVVTTNLTAIVQQIVALNGYFCTKEDWELREYTHYVCETPNYDANTFACIVSGKWLLHPNYVAENMKAGYFLDVSVFPIAVINKQ